MRRIRSIFRSLLLPVWLAPLALLAPVYLTGRALFWGTPLLQFVPWWRTAWEMLLAGRLPLWNPLLGMGAPLLANYQSALFYPPTRLYLLFYSLGGVTAMAWAQAPIVALHLAWAGLGMARLARRLELGELAQALAGLAFGLSGYLVARSNFLSINAAAAWLPWVLLCLTPRPGGAPRRARDDLGLAVCVALQLLAGHAQTTWYTLLLAGLWPAALALASRSPGRARRLLDGWLRLVGAGLLAALIAAAQLLPTAEYLAQSQRSSAVDFTYAMNYSFWPWHLLTLLAPGLFGSPVSGDYWGFSNLWEDALYVGLLPLLLALGAWQAAPANTAAQDGAQTGAEPGALPAGLDRRRLAAWLWGVCGVGLLLALGSHTPLFPWLYRHVPTFAMFQAPARWLIWCEFALALLAGLGADGWRRPLGRGLYWTRLGTMGAVAVLLGAGLAWAWLGEVSPSFIRATALMGLWAVGAGVLSLAAPPPTTAGGQLVSAPPPQQKLRFKVLEGLERRLAERLQSAAQRVQPPRRPYPLRRWQAAVVALVALDLLAAGWGLTPGIDLALYAGRSPSAGQLQQQAGGGRIYMPLAQEDRLKYVRFLRFNTFDSAEDWSALRRVGLANLNLLDELALVNNYDPLVPGRYADFLARLDAAPPALQRRLLQRMDAGLLLTGYRPAPDGVLAVPLTRGGRFRWSACPAPAGGPDEARRLLFDEAAPPARPAQPDAALFPASPAEPVRPVIETLLSDPAACSPDAGPPLVTVELPGTGIEDAGEMRLRVSAGQPGWLVVAESWYPGWQAWVNGQPAPVWRADYLFMAVQLPAGEAQVRLAYRPRSFYLGGALSLLGLLIFMAWGRAARRSARRRA
ncbi:MAG: YfhO family protein [Chloroflexota bacterium]